MNKLTIIGRLTKDPELRTTTSGVNVCTFTVAVDRRKTSNNQDPGADFFKVTAWRERGEVCSRYLAKGNRVCVVGPVSVSTFTGNDGQTRASLDVTADEVEFLTSRNENVASQATNNVAQQATPKIDQQTGFTQVEMDVLPF